MSDYKIGYRLNKHPEHSLTGHPESPDRFTHFNQLSELSIRDNLLVLDAEPIDEEKLGLIHPEPYLERTKEAINRAPARLDAGDTYVTKHSWQAALGSVSAAMAAADYGLKPGQIGFSLSRPPGHHATSIRAMGFCLLNNVALAARHLQQRGIERVLIVDFDVHHGNGTQAIFENDASVFYFSTHQRGIFPGTGYLQDRGKGPGAGTVQNVPLPAFTGDQGYLSLFEPLLMRICGQFQPEMILVSAGYDAHWQDPLANLQFSCQCFHSIGRLLRQAADQHCGGRLALCLEGGYNPMALFHSVVHTLYGLLDKDPPEDPIGEPSREETDISDLMEQVLH